MTETLARLIAEELNGKAHHTGGNIWVVRWTRNDGSIAVLGDMGCFEYADKAHDDDGMESAVILFSFAD